MADGFARASGKIGVALATSGPGATNLVTGIGTAMMDSSPIICVTGQVSSHLIGGDAFQETDVTGITLPVTKHNFLVTSAEEVADGRSRGILYCSKRPAWTGSHRFLQGRPDWKGGISRSHRYRTAWLPSTAARQPRGVGKDGGARRPG